MGKRARMIELQYYQQIITNSIKELPLDALEEIADFVIFIRQKLNKKTMQPQQNNHALLLEELHILNHQQQQHLEREFANYEQQFPKE
jgi:hypothetical protein